MALYCNLDWIIEAKKKKKITKRKISSIFLIQNQARHWPTRVTKRISLPSVPRRSTRSSLMFWWPFFFTFHFFRLHTYLVRPENLPCLFTFTLLFDSVYEYRWIFVEMKIYPKVSWTIRFLRVLVPPCKSIGNSIRFRLGVTRLRPSPVAA